MILNIISPHASNYLGGMEAVTINMAINLASNGITIRFFTRKTDIQTDLFLNLLSKSSTNLKIIEVPVDQLCPIPDGTWPTFYRISCDFGIAAQPLYAQYSDADMFITHLAEDSMFIPRNHQNILHLHGSPYKANPMMSASVGLANHTIAHSQSIKAWWVEHYPDLRPTVFLNGIDTEFYSGTPSEDRPVDVLYVGRFLEHKGIDDILHAVKKDQRVVIAGNGPYLPVLKNIAKHLDLNSVTFYDTPSTEKITYLYKQSKVFACPSRAKEGLLTTLLEAGSSGCAIITTSGSGMTELVRNNINGIVVEPRDATALGLAIDNLLKDNEKRIKLATNIQSEIYENWSWDQKIVELIETYRNATI